MKKYQAIIRFEIKDDFIQLVPAHRDYINQLITQNIIDSYVVSMESQTVWLTLNATTKSEADKLIGKSPLYKFWSYRIEELFVYDGVLFRLPVLQLN